MELYGWATSTFSGTGRETEARGREAQDHLFSPAEAAKTGSLSVPQARARAGGVHVPRRAQAGETAGRPGVRLGAPGCSGPGILPGLAGTAPQARDLLGSQSGIFEK